MNWDNPLPPLKTHNSKFSTGEGGVFFSPSPPRGGSSSSLSISLSLFLFRFNNFLLLFFPFLSLLVCWGGLAGLEVGRREGGRERDYVANSTHVRQMLLTELLIPLF